MARIPNTVSVVGGVVTVRAVRGPAMPLEQTGNRQIDTLQRSLVARMGPAVSCPIVDGNLFEDVPFLSGVDKVVTHGLGRNWRGWVITKVDVYNVFCFSAQPSSLDKFQVTLQAAADCTASVWIFGVLLYMCRHVLRWTI